jgi:hypothetical protein
VFPLQIVSEARCHSSSIVVEFDYAVVFKVIDVFRKLDSGQKTGQPVGFLVSPFRINQLRRKDVQNLKETVDKCGIVHQVRIYMPQSRVMRAPMELKRNRK